MWKEGQKLVCVAKNWQNGKDSLPMPDGFTSPKEGEIYSFKSKSPFNAGQILLNEYPSHFDFSEHSFRETDGTFGTWVEHILMPMVVYEEVLTQK